MVSTEGEQKDMHIFGEEVYVHIPKERRRALDAKAKRGYFIGYGGETKGYRVWYPDDNKIAIARDVIFTGRLNEAIAQKEQDNDGPWVNKEHNTSENEDSEHNDGPIKDCQELQPEP